MLHIVKHSRLLPEVIACANPEDSILLIGDAVYAVNPQHKDHRLIDPSAFSYYFLLPDMQARGIFVEERKGALKSIDFRGFVRLTEAHTSSMTWDIR